MENLALPYETWMKILCYLPYDEFMKCSRVCFTWKKIIEDLGGVAFIQKNAQRCMRIWLGGERSENIPRNDFIFDGEKWTAPREAWWCGWHHDGTDDPRYIYWKFTDEKVYPHPRVYSHPRFATKSQRALIHSEYERDDLFIIKLNFNDVVRWKFKTTTVGKEYIYQPAVGHCNCNTSNLVSNQCKDKRCAQCCTKVDCKAKGHKFRKVQRSRYTL